jgi:ABC-type thiamine transport system ATPase subunit
MASTFNLSSAHARQPEILSTRPRARMSIARVLERSQRGIEMTRDPPPAMQ